MQRQSQPGICHCEAHLELGLSHTQGTSSYQELTPWIGRNPPGPWKNVSTGRLFLMNLEDFHQRGTRPNILNKNMGKSFCRAFDVDQLIVFALPRSYGKGEEVQCHLECHVCVGVCSKIWTAKVLSFRWKVRHNQTHRPVFQGLMPRANASQLAR